MLRCVRRRFAPSSLPLRQRPQLEPLEDRLVLSTFLVTNSSDNLEPGSLRYAIGQANMPGNAGSTVEITPQVTGPINLTSGELSIIANMTISNDSGAAREIHQSTPGSRVLEIGPNATDVTLTGVGPGSILTLDGGSVSGNNGGGILVDTASSTLTLDYVDVLNNSAVAASGNGGNGGGIYAAGPVVLDHSVIGTTAAPNSASGQGGGVWSGTGLALTASSITGNQAGSDGGGVVVNDGSVTLNSGSSVNNNQAPNGMGGGIDVAVGSVFVRNASHVDGNTARDVGGILVGAVAQPGTDAVEVTSGSTVNGNVSTATLSVSTGDFGGGGIATPTTGNVLISASQVSDNHSVGMYSGGIVVGLGSVTVTDGSRIDGNTNNGPGGGIAANFGGVVTVTGGSQVDGNTGAAIGGGIVNFAGPHGGVVISDGSQVNNNVLTNAETLQQAIGVFLQVASSSGDLSKTVAPLAQQLQAVLNFLPPSPLVAGGGIGTLLAPITVEDSSEVDGNIAGKQVQGGPIDSVGDGGGIYNTFGTLDLLFASINNNFALGNGGGIYNAFGSVISVNTSIDGNLALGDGGGIYNASGFVVLVNTFIDGNLALGDGGGVWNGGGLVALAAILAGNGAGQDGGGLFNAQGGTAYLTDSIFLGNAASQNGGAILNLGSFQAFDVTYIDNTPST